MKKISVGTIASLSLTAMVALTFSCAEEGEEGESGVDCGDHGTEHDGHCHCDSGYLFDGKTCADPSQITEVCEAHAEDGGEEEKEHEHAACVCPDEGDCPCDDGKIVTIGGQVYCVPDPHEE